MDSLRCASCRALGLLLATYIGMLPFLATGQEKTKSPEEKPGVLTSRPPQPEAQGTALKVGEAISTGLGQRRRLQLADGGVLFVNQQAEAKLTDAGRLSLSRGEVYVEAPFSKTRKDALTVVTPHQELAGGSSHFTVRVDKAGTMVVVARGSVQVKELKDQLQAGHRPVV